MKVTKPKKFYFSSQQKEIAVTILKILAMGTLLAVAVVAPNAIQILEITSGRKRKIKRLDGNSAWRIIQKLESNKQVNFWQKDDQTIVSITKKGKTEILKFDLDKMTIKKPQKWDRCWRLVIFDIPEHKKKAREALRFLLKRLEFFQLQKSVFIHPYECQKEIDFIKEVYEISPYVTYLKAKKIDNEGFLKNKFNLIDKQI